VLKERSIYTCNIIIIIASYATKFVTKNYPVSLLIMSHIIIGYLLLHHSLLSMHQWDSRDLAAAAGNRCQSVIHVPVLYYVGCECGHAPH
jgi:hypothetical protein